MTYNADGSVKEVLTQDWNVSGAKWVDSGKEAYSYTANGSVSQILTTEWLATQNKWDNQSRITYGYSATSILQPEMAATDLQVFPNPFTDVISIRCNSANKSSIQLFSANGQLVRTFEKGEPLSGINLTDLKNGIYLLKVSFPESQQIIKLMKNK